MSQNVVNYGVDPSGAQLLDELLTGEQQNRLTGDSGPSRPSYAEPGTIWADTSVTGEVTLKRFNGTSDNALMTITLSDGSISIPGIAVSDMVTKSTTQTITGDKTHEGELNIDNNFTGSGYSSAVKFSSNGTAKGYIYYSSTDDDFAITDTSYNLSTLRVKTQAATDDSNKVATTNWVNTTGNNVCHLSSDESITGDKTFTSGAIIKIKYTGQEIGPIIYHSSQVTSNSSIPSNDSYRVINFRANDESVTGYIYNNLLATGVTHTGITAVRKVNGTNVNCAIRALVANDGSIYTEAPTPALASDGSQKIATTAWCRLSNIKTPDYTAAHSITICTQDNYSTNLPYTCPDNGWILLGPDANSYINIKINGGLPLIALNRNASYNKVAKGDIVTYNSSTGTWTVIFVPDR